MTLEMGVVLMPVTAEMVKMLRNRSGAGVMDCKEALSACDGDMEKAIDYLRTKGLAAASKKAGRATTQGVVGSYIHINGKIGVLVEVNCETDFVANTPEFREFVKDTSMHIAAANPLCLDRQSVPPDLLDRERGILLQQARESGKPDHIVERMVEGRLEKFYEETCLLEQFFVKDDKVKMEQLLKSKIAQFGENISIRRFCRFQVGDW
jgi:elongation factor Ts